MTRVFVTGVVLIVTVAIVVFLGVGSLAGKLGRPVLPVFGQGAVETVSPGAVLREENSYICGDSELVFQGPAPADMVGKKDSELRARYPAKDGWSLAVQNGRLVVLRKSVDGFCGEHSHYRHLGIYRDRLAVYQGPLGFDQRLLRVEDNKTLDLLPPFLLEKLKRAQEYGKLSPDEKEALRADLEFSDENLLNSYLENLDEVE